MGCFSVIVVDAVWKKNDEQLIFLCGASGDSLSFINGRKAYHLRCHRRFHSRCEAEADGQYTQNNPLLESKCVNSCCTYFKTMLLMETYPTVTPDRRRNDVHGQEKRINIQQRSAFTHTFPLRSDRSVCRLQLWRWRRLFLLPSPPAPCWPTFCWSAWGWWSPGTAPGSPLHTEKEPSRQRWAQILFFPLLKGERKDKFNQFGVHF